MSPYEVDREALEAAYPDLFGQGAEIAAVRRAHYGGDILPHDPDRFWNWLDYFAWDREGVAKGYILLQFMEGSLS